MFDGSVVASATTAPRRGKSADGAGCDQVHAKQPQSVQRGGTVTSAKIVAAGARRRAEAIPIRPQWAR